MRKADHTSRAAAALVDLLIIIGLARLPDVMGFLAAAGYILLRDGLFDHRSVGKKLIGLHVLSAEKQGPIPTYRESIIRNLPIVTAYFLFLIPYVGWVLGPAVLGVEFLTMIGDNAGMRIGDMLARTHVALAVPAADTPQDPRTTGPASADTKAM